MNIVSVQGLQFASWFYRAFCHLLGATANLFKGFIPECSGQTESQPGLGVFIQVLGIHQTLTIGVASDLGLMCP